MNNPRNLKLIQQYVCASWFVPLLLLLALPAVTRGQFIYTTNNGSITITAYTGPGGVVTIPSTDGLPVTSIGDFAFSSCTSLTSVTIPDGVTYIGRYAFALCSSLTNVTIPSSVSYIGEPAFYSCTSLSVITVDPNNSAYSSAYGVLFNKSQTTLIHCPGAEAESYTIPNGVTSIEDWAFNFCTSLTNITFGNSVTNIGSAAFYYCTSLTSVTIPDSVTYIGDSAFSLCSSLTGVTIPDSVTNIGKGAFYGCSSLTSVTIPNGVTSIEDWAFHDCGRLTSVTIGNRVWRIGEEAFRDCFSLTNVTIPNNVTSIGNGAFSYCGSLSAITVDALNSTYRSVAGVLFNQNQTTLLQYPGGKAGGYTVPNVVTNIAVWAFAYCVGLTSVTIPNSVTYIGDWAFSQCSSLTNITIPNSVTNIGFFVFYYCTGLTSVTIPDGVTSIGQSAFSECSSLTNVIIGNSVTSIGDWAFENCANLSKIMIPNSVTSVGECAFENCASLSKIMIPNSVTSLGEGPFSGCSSLSAITVDVHNPVYMSIDGVMFDKSQTLLIECPGGKSGSYTIPNSVTSIGDGAFALCTSLANVTLDNSLTNIGNAAFFDCTRLTAVYSQGNPPSGSFVSSVFSGDVNATIYYLPGTTGWGTTFAGRPTALWVLPNPLILNIGPTFGVQTNGFGFIISWATNASVVVEASTDLANPIWTPLATNTLTSGSSCFVDPEWTNYPARFYRVRSP